MQCDFGSYLFTGEGDKRTKQNGRKRHGEGGSEGERKRKRRREGEKEKTRNKEGARQMPRGRSERGRKMEINGEWQLGD